MRPNPGHRPFQRLNRAEYDLAIQGLLGLDVDVSALLPPDTISHGFDNIADVQVFSPTVLEGYLRAAAKISRDAIGDQTAAPSGVIYKVPRTAAQLQVTSRARRLARAAGLRSCTSSQRTANTPSA